MASEFIIKINLISIWAHCCFFTLSSKCSMLLHELCDNPSECYSISSSDFSLFITSCGFTCRSISFLPSSFSCSPPVRRFCFAKLIFLALLTPPFTNTCSSSFSAVHRSCGFTYRHLSRKSLSSSEICSGSGGAEFFSYKNSSACTGFWKRPQGGAAVSISITKQPRLQMSDFFPDCCWLNISGAIQLGVPFSEYASSAIMLHPKSASLQTPVVSTSTFAPLMSRCKIPF